MVKVDVPCEIVSIEEMMKASNLVIARKVVGPSGVTSELLKVC